jgi:DNA-binding NarL/FixJ family response regulator
VRTLRRREGLSQVSRAKALGVSDKTVKTHVSNLLLELGLDDRTQLAVFAWRSRIGRGS